MTSLGYILIESACGQMNNPFDFQPEDPYLRFIRDDSSANNSALFKNEPSEIKAEEEEMREEPPQDKTEIIAVKRKRSDIPLKSASRKKVFYRDKMASLISEQEMQEKDDYNYGDYSNNCRGRSPISREEQLRRNRESAKHSRQRRKEYVETLEERNLQNQRTIQELTHRLQQAERERDRLRDDNRSYIKEFMNAKNEAFEKMHNILQMRGKKCSQLISEELKIMKAKFGAAGSERVATTDYYMKEIVDILLGDVHKYLMHSALHNSGIFGLTEWTSFDDKICEILRVNKDIRVGLAKNYRFQMLQEFQSFKDITQRFYDAYRAVQNQAKVIEKIFDRCSLEFPDERIGQLLIWIEENKFQKQLRKIRAEWITSIEAPCQETGNARKISHLQRDSS